MSEKGISAQPQSHKNSLFILIPHILVFPVFQQNLRPLVSVGPITNSVQTQLLFELTHHLLRKLSIWPHRNFPAAPAPLSIRSCRMIYSCLAARRLINHGIINVLTFHKIEDILGYCLGLLQPAGVLVALLEQRTEESAADSPRSSPLSVVSRHFALKYSVFPLTMSILRAACLYG